MERDNPISASPKSVAYSVVLVVALAMTALAESPAESISALKVAVFAGHTESLTWKRNNRGAKSASGVYEYRFNDEVTKLFSDADNSGIEYIALPASLNIPRKSRPALAVALGASAIVEIHHDSVQPRIYRRLIRARKGNPMLEYYRGFSLHVNGDAESVELAKALESSLIDVGIPFSTYHGDNIRGERRRLIPGTEATYERRKLYLLRSSPLPAIIVECGCIANPQEERLLQTDWYKRKIVSSIKQGISRWAGSSKGTNKKP
ncbi:N-acetylmuramoyl-L-alanine amidase [Thermodesulfobacteriota bacterium]